MQTGFMGHMGEEALERYSMGTLPEDELGPFEEHLLICPKCQERLKETDAYVRAMRAAAARLRNKRSPAWKDLGGKLSLVLTLPRPVLAAGGIILLLAVAWIAGPWRVPRAADALPVAVVLQTARGAEDIAGAQAPSGKPLLLEMDLTELPGLTSCGLEVVDARGRLVWESTARPEDGRLSAPVSRPLGEGKYWVRLYRLDPQKELLREYGMNVR
jgi:hypothetical protein